MIALTRGFRKIVQAPALILILMEYNTMYRQIFTDGRPLPADPNPSWSGYSTGKWNGDTLVVETNGFRDGIWIDSGGHPITDAAKLRIPTDGDSRSELVSIAITNWVR